jgi:hypothetical protein
VPSPTLLPETPKPGQSSGRTHLTDDRLPGNWKSRYSRGAWIQILLELLYLVSGLALALSLLYQIAVSTHAVNGPGIWPSAFHGASRHTLAIGAVAVGGACGGFAFALKWLYHGVAYGWWNRDRLVWRLIVPVLSATLALFTALMIGSGLIPLFNSHITDGPRMGAAYGFFAGFFSDNLLAALQRLADQTLGTLGRVESKQEKPKDP